MRERTPWKVSLHMRASGTPKIEEIVARSAGGNEAVDNLCLTHVRCNAKQGCDTAEVKERARIKHEAALFAKSKQRRRRASAS